MCRLGLLWQLTKGDIDTTIKNVCKKVLRDNSVTKERRARRAKALLLLGREYCRRSVVEQQAISDFLERLGQQTGLFGQTPAGGDGDGDGETFNPVGENATGGTGGAGGGSGGAEEAKAGEAGAKGPALSVDELTELISRVDGMSVRELKEYIALLGGDAADGSMIEKADMRKRLNALLEERFNEAELS